jgi:peptidoglycan/xylan/chitin deacetylase (PgdA/CDA1 family)
MTRASIRKTAFYFSKPFTLNWLKHLSGQQFIFPFYHTVSNTEIPHIRNLYPVCTEKQFRSDLDFLLSKYQPATFTDVLNFVKNGRKSSKPYFFLSFDDGFAECATVIAPILKEKGIEAAFFVNPAFIDNPDFSHRQKISLIIEKMVTSNETKLEEIRQFVLIENSSVDFLVQALKKFTFKDEELIDKIATIFNLNFKQLAAQIKPYLTQEQLKKLHSEGFIIGSHGFDHSEFQLLTTEEMKQQVEKSFTYLESNLNIENRIFSFPFTDHEIPRSFFNYLQNKTNVVASFGTAGLKNDEVSNHIQRIPAELEGFDSARQIIRAEYFYYLAKVLAGKNQILRK